MLRNVFLGFMRVHVLYHAAREPIYGAAMMQELRRHGYEIGPGTFYPLLHRMEERELLQSKERVVEGRARKYYVATEEGLRALQAAEDKLRELSREVLEGEGPSSLSELDDQL